MIKLKQFFLSLILFTVFDFLWLGYVMKDFNLRQLADIGRIENGEFQIQYLAAFLAYFFMALAVPIYIVPTLNRNVSGKSWINIFSKGALLGLIIYGVFDMTNLAVLKNYPILFIFPDMLWGAFIYGLVTCTVVKLSDRS